MFCKLGLGLVLDSRLVIELELGLSLVLDLGLHCILTNRTCEKKFAVQQHVLGVVGNVIHCFVGNLTDFLAVKEF